MRELLKDDVFQFVFCAVALGWVFYDQFKTNRQLRSLANELRAMANQPAEQPKGEEEK